MDEAVCVNDHKQQVVRKPGDVWTLPTENIPKSQGIWMKTKCTLGKIHLTLSMAGQGCQYDTTF